MIPIVAAAATRRPWTPGVSPAFPPAIPYGMPPRGVANDPLPLSAANDTLAADAALGRADRRDKIRGALITVGVLTIVAVVIVVARVGLYAATHSDLPVFRDLLNAFN